MLTMKRK